MLFKDKMIAIVVLLGYTLVLTACAKKSDLDGTDTSGGGEDTSAPVAPPLDDPTVLLDKTIIFEIKDSNWSVPRGSGPEFGQYVPVLMFKVTAVNPDNSLTFDLGTAVMNETSGAWEHDPCTVTVSMTGTLDANPHFTTTAMDFRTYVHNPSADDPYAAATLFDMFIGGNFTYDDATGAAGISRGTFSGTFDFREVAQMLHTLKDPTEQQACEMAPDYNADCSACRDDSEPYCLEIGAELIKASETTALMDAQTSACYE